MRYKNWKMYYSMAQPGADGWVQPLVNYHFTVVQNIKRDPFEQTIGALPGEAALSTVRSLGAPMSAFQYDFNILPAVQMLWLRHLETYEKFPPLQDPATYNLTQVLEQVKKANTHPSE